MNSEITIRSETNDNIRAIATDDQSVPGLEDQQPHRTVHYRGAPRRQGPHPMLVAEVDGRVIGHIAFSPVIRTAHRTGTDFGPFSVLPKYQRQGIGKA